MDVQKKMQEKQGLEMIYEYLKDEKKDLIHLEKLDRESCLEVFEKYEKMNGIIY